MAEEALYYSIVRVVPHPVRDEALNLGVVVVNEGGDYANYRFVRGYKVKLHHIAPDFDSGLVSVFLRDFTSRFPRTGGPHPFDAWGAYEPRKETLVELANQFGYQIRFTPPRVYVTEQPDTALDGLFHEFVSPVRGAQRAMVDRPKIRARVERAFTAWGVPKELVVKRPELRGKYGPNTLDLGIRAAENGHLTLAVEPISFSIPSRDDVVRERDHLAWVAYDVSLSDARPTICAVISEPLPVNRQIYGQTISMFGALGVEIVPVDELEALRTLIPQV